MGAVTRSYGGLPAAERSAKRRAALVEAALDLFAEGGANAVTKRSVCARARLNDRYFYEHFADRDAMLEAIARDMTEEGLAAVVSATFAAAPDVPAQVHAAADAAIAFVTADPRRGRMLLAPTTTEVLQRARLDSITAIAAAMAGMTAELLGDSAPTRLDLEMMAFAAVSGVMELVAAWLRGEFATGREHLVDVVAAMLLSGVTS
ncbi:TetR/AcrR family transcriptional regulator [Nocardia sp. NPDC051570]|uniref:TetR/AcrR family transcriptional regulator n=1 Tax=Nocardia sp. NPDC051570 TaxID=3364324 RepID=UPI0037A4A4F1